ncbi:MAG TPA: preprotein translocase subunit SecG [Gammaproteobacteria bacterium]|nr:preprotein translocase subunit SecG [Gammaproteobacteria bacterium]
MFTILLILQVVMGLAIIGLVLLQQGKGADMGAAFGAGSAGTVFGARGGGSFFTRATAVLATGFFINSVLLSSPVVRSEHDPSTSVTESVPVETEIPAVETIDLPPADLPEVPELSGETATPATDDLPEVPAEPAADTNSDLPE